MQFNEMASPFTVMCLVTWSLIESEAEVGVVWVQTKHVDRSYAKQFAITFEKRWGLYQIQRSKF